MENKKAPEGEQELKLKCSNCEKEYKRECSKQFLTDDYNAICIKDFWHKSKDIQ